MRHPERQLFRYGFAEKPAHPFRVLPRRSAVERTFAWPGRSRRLSTGYARRPATSEAMIYGAMIYGAMIHRMQRRLARAVV